MMNLVHTHCAGIDIGSDELFVCVSRDLPVRIFSTFTRSYESLITHFKDHSISSVAMEATGNYWFSLYEQLDAASIEVYLVNSRHIKYVPGRKSDVQDCQWLQELHSYGLLRRSFIPDDLTRQLRTYTRLRDTHIDTATTCTHRMQKALTSMNIRLHQVISQITGVSGLRILEGILAGERNAEKLADLCVDQIRNTKREQVVLSLEGYYKKEHLFALLQALNGYKFAEAQRHECEQRIEQLLTEATQALTTPSEADCPSINKPKKSRHNTPQVDKLHNHLVTLSDGKDAAQITGLSDSSWLKIIGEVGTDLSKWPTSAQFVSWLGLSPKINKSSKRVKKARYTTKPRAGQIFREAAYSIANSKYLELGAFYRGIKARRGPSVANVATARKIAIRFYNLIQFGTQFVEQGIEQYQNKLKERLLKNTQRTAKILGYDLVVAK